MFLGQPYLFPGTTPNIDLFQKLSPSSVWSDDPTVPLTTLRSICTTRPSCRSFARSWNSYSPVIFLLLYTVFHNLTEAIVLIFPTFYAMTGGLILQWLLGYNFSVAVWVGYIALFGIAVETGVVMVVYLHESLGKRIASGCPLTDP